MKDVFIVNKPPGLTPLQALEKLKLLRPELKDTALTYAGRLDPIAEGLLLILSNKAIKDKEQYLDMPKTYKATIVLGFQTDTYDVMGVPKVMPATHPIQGNEIETNLKQMVGKIELPLPPYSSVPVNGKPLFMWARENRLDEITLPIRQTEIYSIEEIVVTELEPAVFLKQVQEIINAVSGDFRQPEILQQWKTLLSNRFGVLQLISLTVNCSSGTYIRSLSHELGKKLGTSATLFKLKRTEVGPYKIEDAITLS